MCCWPEIPTQKFKKQKKWIDGHTTTTNLIQLETIHGVKTFWIITLIKGGKFF